MEEVKVLDHGYMKFIEGWGSDESIIEAARMSTGKGFLGWGPVRRCTQHTAVELTCANCRFDQPGDEKLLKFLWDNKHSTPFEMGGMIIEVQAPIFVFREWHRHRTQSYNEMSARYTPLPDVNYMPTVERCMMVSGTNKQAGRVAGADDLTHEQALSWLEDLSILYDLTEWHYQRGLRLGIPKEVARVGIPVGRYSKMRASTNLRNWLAFMTLRSDVTPGAQWEIRQFANVMGRFIAERFPRTWELFRG